MPSLYFFPNSTTQSASLAYGRTYAITEQSFPGDGGIESASLTVPGASTISSDTVSGAQFNQAVQTISNPNGTLTLDGASFTNKAYVQFTGKGLLVPASAPNTPGPVWMNDATAVINEQTVLGGAWDLEGSSSVFLGGSTYDYSLWNLDGTGTLSVGDPAHFHGILIAPGSHDEFQAIFQGMNAASYTYNFAASELQLFNARGTNIDNIRFQTSTGSIWGIYNDGGNTVLGADSNPGAVRLPVHT
jgi:hypothetical protein